jgi:hypothetical protein
LISGVSGHGPVDYAMSYLNVLIVIGEAKHKSLLEGLYQNLVQQWNALQSLADKMVGSATVGTKRSREFIDTMSMLRDIGTCGIASTGELWQFSRIRPIANDNTKNRVEKSQEMSLTIRGSSDNEAGTLVNMKMQVDHLLRTIVHMVMSQKSKINEHPDIMEAAGHITAEEGASLRFARDALELEDADPVADDNIGQLFEEKAFE